MPFPGVNLRVSNLSKVFISIIVILTASQIITHQTRRGISLFGISTSLPVRAALCVQCTTFHGNARKRGALGDWKVAQLWKLASSKCTSALELEHDGVGPASGKDSQWGASLTKERWYSGFSQEIHFVFSSAMAHHQSKSIVRYEKNLADAGRPAPSGWTSRLSVGCGRLLIVTATRSGASTRDRGISRSSSQPSITKKTTKKEGRYEQLPKQS
ncbi:hypothetical protein B0T20DRAFT_170673 [Sordaria brevicollis]|uniref:Uncharacterized protein n=1 Tax=Sordaria brevicollis TaxID=83679 RepID=A0AAE0PH46_SORBR|nr:hypothetical protein B0T20DRAFT_170673 [Sordaria brevicollis]